MTRAQHERTKVLEAALKEKVQQIEECRRELRQKDRENASLQQSVDKMLKKLPEQDKGEFKHINQGNITAAPHRHADAYIRDLQCFGLCHRNCSGL
jgi:hypothetical protein